MILKSIFVFLLYCYFGSRKAQANIILENSSPAIRGANVTFTVTVTNHTEELLKFWFYDITGFSTSIITREQTFNVTVECKKEKYDAGNHGFEVRIYRRGKSSRFYTWKTFKMFDSAHTTFTLTETLNGGPKMIQRGEYLYTDYVYPFEQVYHYLEIPHEEHMFLEQEPTERLYYWYINCDLVEVTRDFCILHTYEDARETYDLRVVLVVKKKTLITTTTTTTAAPVMHPGVYQYDFRSHKSGSQTTDRYNNWSNRGTTDRSSRRYYGWDDDRPRPTTDRYNSWSNRGTSERPSRRYYGWDDDQSSGTSPRPRPTTDRYNNWSNRGTSERPSRRNYDWDNDQSSGTSPRPRPTTDRYNNWSNRGTSERPSRRYYIWDDDQSSGTSPRPRPTTDRYNSWSNRGTSERNSHRYYKRDGYNGHYNKRRFDDDQCFPDIDSDVFAYGVYDQTIHIIDRNNPPTTTTSTTSTTTPEPVIIIDPISPTGTESPEPLPPPAPTTDKDKTTNVKVINSTITGDVPPFSIFSHTELPKNIHFRGILNIILKGSYNIEYSET